MRRTHTKMILAVSAVLLGAAGLSPAVYAMSKSGAPANVPPPNPSVPNPAAPAAPTAAIAAKNLAFENFIKDVDLNTFDSSQQARSKLSEMASGSKYAQPLIKANNNWTQVTGTRKKSVLRRDCKTSLAENAVKKGQQLPTAACATTNEDSWAREYMQSMDETNGGKEPLFNIMTLLHMSDAVLNNTDVAEKISMKNRWKTALVKHIKKLPALLMQQ